MLAAAAHELLHAEAGEHHRDGAGFGDGRGDCDVVDARVARGGEVQIGQAGPGSHRPW